MKGRSGLCGVALAALVGALAGCAGEEAEARGAALLQLKLPSEADAAVARSVAAGQETAGGTAARTLHPANMSAWTYTVAFRYLGGELGPADLFRHEDVTVTGATSLGYATKQVNLELGTWEFVAHGWVGGTEVARSAPGLGLSREDETTTVTLVLSPYAVGQGTLHYAVTLPPAAEYGGSFTVTTLAGEPAAGPVNLAGETNGDIPGLDAGEYLLTAIAGGPSGWGAITEVVHIYQEQTSVFAWAPGDVDINNKPVTDLDLTAKVPRPVAGEAPVREFEASEYSGEVEWVLHDGAAFEGAAFQGQTYYTAKVTLSPRLKYTFALTGKDSFRHDDAAAVSNPAGTGLVTVEFAQTAGEAPKGDVDVQLGFNYAAGAITISGPESNTIYMDKEPRSISFTVDASWERVAWYVSGFKVTEGLSDNAHTLLLYADSSPAENYGRGLGLGTHSVTFTGRKDGHTYAKMMTVVVSAEDMTPLVAVLDVDADSVSYHRWTSGLSYESAEVSAAWGHLPTYSGGVFTIRNVAPGKIKFYELKGADTSDRVVVDRAAEVTLLLDGVTLSPASGSPLSLERSEVTLLLRNDNTLTAASDAAALRVTSGSTLLIDSSGSTSSSPHAVGGTLTASGGSRGAGIGGSPSEPGGSITISGGTVNATGGEASGAGIGGGVGGEGGVITISGGAVTAAGGGSGAGIGGGNNGAAGNITISGGAVTAAGGGNGAGIGGGGSSLNTSGGVTISGGAVTATGGSNGAGIGGGSSGAGGDVSIKGGTVDAIGGSNGAGIGGGYQGEGGNITISGGSGRAVGTGAKSVGPGSGRNGGTFNGVADDWPTANPYAWP